MHSPLIPRAAFSFPSPAVLFYYFAPRTTSKLLAVVDWSKTNNVVPIYHIFHAAKDFPEHQFIYRRQHWQWRYTAIYQVRSRQRHIAVDTAFHTYYASR